MPTTAKNRKENDQKSAYSFGFNTATSPHGNAYVPSPDAISMDLGIPVGGFPILMS